MSRQRNEQNCLVPRKWHFRQIIFFWQKALRQEAYIQSEIAVATKPVLPSQETGINFVELRSQEQETPSGREFRPDLVIRKGNISLEISNSASAELLSLIGGILHA